MAISREIKLRWVVHNTFDVFITIFIHPSKNSFLPELCGLEIAACNFVAALRGRFAIL